MKDFFGWFLVVTGRYNQFSEASKTLRGIYGLGIILMLYYMGFFLNSLIVLYEFGVLDILKKSFSTQFISQIGGGIFVGSGVLSIVLLKLTYNEEVINYYIEKYRPIDEIEDKRQRRLSHLFVIGGLATLASPVFINWLLNN